MAITFLNGYIADDPATAAVQVRISVPNLTQLDRVVYGPMNFRPKLSAEGGVVFPQRGSAALIAVDDSADGKQWIVSWEEADGVDTTVKATGSVGATGIPVGASLEWNAAGDPPGGNFMVEDGRTLNSVTDATLTALYAVIGTTWGGTGPADFKIPDSRGRTTIGAGTGVGLTARTLANILGTEPSNMPNHTHSGTTGTVSSDHTHFYNSPYICCTIDGGLSANVTAETGANTGGISANHTHAFTTGLANSGDVTNNNMQPSIVKNKIIRVR